LNVVVEVADLASAVKNPRYSISPAFTFVDFYKHWFTCNNLTTSLAKSEDVAFGDWGTSLLSDEQIIYATMEVCATYMVANKLCSLGT
jgi:hypothetical protein